MPELTTSPTMDKSSHLMDHLRTAKMGADNREYMNLESRSSKLGRLPDQVSRSVKMLSGLKMLRNTHSTKSRGKRTNLDKTVEPAWTQNLTPMLRRTNTVEPLDQTLPPTRPPALYGF